jgi:hypothetical protein
LQADRLLSVRRVGHLASGRIADVPHDTVRIRYRRLDNPKIRKPVDKGCEGY